MNTPSLPQVIAKLASYTSNGPRLIRLYHVMELTALPKSTIYELMKIDAFPKSVKIGKRGVAWVETEIIEWINGRINVSRS